MNFWGFTPEIFQQIRSLFSAFLRDYGNEMKSEFYIPFVVDELISSSLAEVQALETKSHWFGVTYQADRPMVFSMVNKLVEDGTYPSPLWK